MLWLSFPLFLLSRLAEGPRSSTSDASIEPDGDGDSDPGEFGRRPAAPAHRRPFAFRPRPQPLPGIHRPTASFVRLVDRPNQSSRVPPCPPKVQLKMRPIRRRRPRLPADLFRPRERWFDVGGRPLQPTHQPTRSPPPGQRRAARKQRRFGRPRLRGWCSALLGPNSDGPLPPRLTLLAFCPTRGDVTKKMRPPLSQVSSGELRGRFEHRGGSSLRAYSDAPRHIAPLTESYSTHTQAKPRWR